jgi:methyl-accepting chemotaxis protein
LKLQYDSVVAAIDYEGRTALAVSSVIATLPAVADAVTKGDRDALGSLLGGAMTALKAQGIPLVNVWTPPATNFYRVHEPKIFGDDTPSGASPWWRRTAAESRSRASNRAVCRSASSA